MAYRFSSFVCRLGLDGCRLGGWVSTALSDFVSGCAGVFAKASLQGQIPGGNAGLLAFQSRLSERNQPHPFGNFRSLRTALAVQATRLVPIGLGAVIRVDFGTPGTVSHVRPMLLVETGCGLEQFFIDV